MRSPFFTRAAFITLALSVFSACSKPDEKAAAPTKAEMASPITVGPNVTVSAANPKWHHTEYMASADPKDPNKIMLCTMLYSQERDQLQSGIYLTDDGGKSWRFALGDTSSRFMGVWDPACVYGVNGEVYLTTLSMNEDVAKPKKENEEPGTYGSWKVGGHPDSYMPLYVSTDDGRTFSHPIDLGFIDNQDMLVDTTNSKYRGRIYVYGNSFPLSSLWLVYSADGGKTWKQSAETKVTGGVNAQHDGPGTLLPSGTVLMTFSPDRYKGPPEGRTTTLAVAATRDGGEHISQPVDVATYKNCYSRYKKPGVYDSERIPGFILSVMTSDHSSGPFKGRAYIAWGAINERDQCVLQMAHSDDEGKTWSEPVQVTDAPPVAGGGPDVFLPQIVVNKEGIVLATWYDRRDDPKQHNHRLRASASLDGGQTWLPSVPVSDHEFVFGDEPDFPANAGAVGGGRRRTGKRTDHFDVTVWPGPRLYEPENNGMGDYAAIAAGTDGRFHAFWIDNRTGVAQMYTAAIDVAGKAAKTAPEVADLDNVTSQLELQYTGSVYDSKSRTLSLEYQLLNTSVDTVVTGPLKLRVLSMSSFIGLPKIELPNGGEGHMGSVIDISSAIPSEGLLPGKTTTAQHMTLHFAPGKIERDRALTIAKLSAEVYGHKSAVKR